MESSNLNYQRRCAVSKAWSRERREVLQSRGSRNWSQKEQREIIATGKCHGYEGQHMLSVKSHPEYAGKETNIQFLTHEEHFQAHGGNWKNDANGRYNLRTKKVDLFEGGIPQTNYRKLSDPLSERAKKIANTKYGKRRDSSEKLPNEGKLTSKKRERLPVRKTSVSSSGTDKKAISRNFFNSKANSTSSPQSVNSNSSRDKSSTSKDKGNGMGF